MTKFKSRTDSKPGIFITFEASEAAGKDTQVAILEAKINSEYKTEVVSLRDPGGTVIGEKLREIIKTKSPDYELCSAAEMLCTQATRAQLVAEKIVPALKAGKIVICNRFYDSTVAYQGFGRGISLKLIQDVIEYTTMGIKPVMTLYLRVDRAVALERVKKSRPGAAGDRFDLLGDAFFARVNEGFEAQAKMFPLRIFPIDANESIDQVALDIWNRVKWLVDTHYEQDPA